MSEELNPVSPVRGTKALGHLLLRFQGYCQWFGSEVQEPEALVPKEDDSLGDGFTSFATTPAHDTYIHYIYIYIIFSKKGSTSCVFIGDH